MHSRWSMVDSLMREIGALRNEARAIGPRTVDEKIVAEVDRVIADAAQAIDETIAEPEDESRLLGACEAIVIARERIEALRATAKRAGEIVGRSIELRRQAGRGPSYAPPNQEDTPKPGSWPGSRPPPDTKRNRHPRRSPSPRPGCLRGHG